MDETLEKKSGGTRTLNALFLIISICFVMFHMYTALFGAFPGVIQKGIHLGFVLALFFLGEMMVKDASLPRKLFSLVMLVGGILGAGYFVVIDDNMQDRLGLIITPDIVFGLILIAVIFVAAQRCVGNAMVIVTLVFIAYGFLGPIFPGFLGHQGLSLKRFINLVCVTSDGIWGTPIYASFVYRPVRDPRCRSAGNRCGRLPHRPGHQCLR